MKALDIIAAALAIAAPCEAAGKTRSPAAASHLAARESIGQENAHDGYGAEEDRNDEAVEGKVKRGAADHDIIASARPAASRDLDIPWPLIGAIAGLAIVLAYVGLMTDRNPIACGILGIGGVILLLCVCQAVTS